MTACVSSFHVRGGYLQTLMVSPLTFDCPVFPLEQRPSYQLLYQLLPQLLASVQLQITSSEVSKRACQPLTEALSFDPSFILGSTSKTSSSPLHLGVKAHVHVPSLSRHQAGQRSPHAKRTNVKPHDKPNWRNVPSWPTCSLFGPIPQVAPACFKALIKISSLTQPHRQPHAQVRATMTPSSWLIRRGTLLGYKKAIEARVKGWSSGWLQKKRKEEREQQLIFLWSNYLKGIGKAISLGFSVDRRGLTKDKVFSLFYVWRGRGTDNFLHWNLFLSSLFRVAHLSFSKMFHVVSWSQLWPHSINEKGGICWWLYCFYLWKSSRMDMSSSCLC